jgi:hypothetical protein
VENSPGGSVQDSAHSRVQAEGIAGPAAQPSHFGECGLAGVLSTEGSAVSLC